MADPASLFPPSVTQSLTTKDGRALCFADWADDGYPVVSFHGTPGCRLSIRVPPVATEFGGRLITYDRPGCGRSDRLPDRSVVDCVADVAAIVDLLGLDEFAVLGGSGGVPPALAVAVLMPERVSRVACYAPLASYTELGPEEWSRGQEDETTVETIAAALGSDDEAVRAYTKVDVKEREGCSPEEPADAGAFEQFRQGVWGTIDDERAHLKPWGFDVATVTAPTMIWFDPKDACTPPQHAAWLGRTIPRAELFESDSMGHGSTGDPTKDRAAMYTWVIHGQAPTS